MATANGKSRWCSFMSQRGRKHVDYKYRIEEGPELSEQEADELAHMLALWIYGDLQQKRKMPIVDEGISRGAKEESNS